MDVEALSVAPPCRPPVPLRSLSSLEQRRGVLSLITPSRTRTHHPPSRIAVRTRNPQTHTGPPTRSALGVHRSRARALTPAHAFSPSACAVTASVHSVQSRASEREGEAEGEGERERERVGEGEGEGTPAPVTATSAEFASALELAKVRGCRFCVLQPCT